jgi:hypothetical protein
MDWFRFERGEPGRFRILPPIVDDLTDWYEQLFAVLYATGDLTLYIDEAYAVVPPGTRAGKWLSALYTRGRELGIGVWTSTQRPTWVPLFMLSEADWFMVFRLNLKADRERLASLVGASPGILNPIPDPHGFWLYHVNADSATYYQRAVPTEPEVESPGPNSRGGDVG